MKTEHWTQENALAALLTPAAARAAGTYATDAVDATVYLDRLVATTLIGTLAGAATINTRWQHCSGSVSSDSAWADISSASCITSTFASASNDKASHLELRLDQNPATSRYVRALASVATSTWIGGITVFGEPRYQPAADVDNAAVGQIVVY